MAGSDEIVEADTRPLDRLGRRSRAIWALALVLVWAALAIGDSVLILPSGVASSHLGYRPAPHARIGPHRHRHLAINKRRQSARVVLQWFVPINAAAFGPTGYGSGDNNQLAPLAIDHSTLTAWRSAWYRSAAFGGLQSGTGLLLDLGGPVRIASVVIRLGDLRGADLRLIAEWVPHPPTQEALAHITDAGGLVRIRLSRRVWARYLLIWFTLLPPDGTGTFQASIYDVGAYIVKTQPPTPAGRNMSDQQSPTSSPSP